MKYVVFKEREGNKLVPVIFPENCSHFALCADLNDLDVDSAGHFKVLPSQEVEVYGLVVPALKNGTPKKERDSQMLYHYLFGLTSGS